MNDAALLEQVLHLARQLPLKEKLRLIEQLAPEIEKDIDQEGKAIRRSLRGLWKGIETTEDDIEAIRQELWQDFPRGARP